MCTRYVRGCSNRYLTKVDLHRLSQFKANGLTLWEQFIEQPRLSNGSSLQLLRVSYTIADMNGQDTAQAEGSDYCCTYLMGDHSAGALSL